MQYFLPSSDNVSAEPAFPHVFWSDRLPRYDDPKSSTCLLTVTAKALCYLTDLNNSNRSAKVIPPIFSVLLKSPSSVGPLPQPEYFGVDSTMLGEKKPFLAQYAADEVRICDLRREPCYRCQWDVRSPRESCRSQRNEFVTSTHIFCEKKGDCLQPHRSLTVYTTRPTARRLRIGMSRSFCCKESHKTNALSF